MVLDREASRNPAGAWAVRFRTSGNRRSGNLRQEPEAFVPGGAGFFLRIFGALKDTVTLESGTDLTSLTGEKWCAGR